MKWLGTTTIALIITILLSLGLYKLFKSPVNIIKDIEEPRIEFTEIVFDDSESIQLKAEIRSIIKQPQVCNTASDCLKSHYGCPFGCSSLVNVDNHQKIINLKKVLAVKTGSRCKYRCRKENTKTSPACIENICSVVETIDGQKNIRQFIENNKKKQTDSKPSI